MTKTRAGAAYSYSTENGEQMSAEGGLRANIPRAPVRDNNQMLSEGPQLPLRRNVHRRAAPLSAGALSTRGAFYVHFFPFLPGAVQYQPAGEEKHVHMKP